MSVKVSTKNVFFRVLALSTLALSFFYGNTNDTLNVIFHVYYLTVASLLSVASVMLIGSFFYIKKNLEYVKKEDHKHFSDLSALSTWPRALLFAVSSIAHLSVFVYLGWSLIAGAWTLVVLLWLFAMVLINSFKRELAWHVLSN